MGKCAKCGKPTQQEWHTLCTECHRQEQRDPKGHGTTRQATKKSATQKNLAADYLGEGYFEVHGGVLCRKEGIVTQKAQEVAKSLGYGKPKMTSHQLRRFFMHARRLEQRLRYGTTFECIKSEIERLITYAVDARAKQKIPEDFETFIRANVAFALQSEEHFTQGFMPHFEAVVAFFAYYFPKN
jgi:CRISPR type III-A-associated protein Csm2